MAKRIETVASVNGSEQAAKLIEHNAGAPHATHAQLHPLGCRMKGGSQNGPIKVQCACGKTLKIPRQHGVLKAPSYPRARPPGGGITIERRRPGDEAVVRVEGAPSAAAIAAALAARGVR